MKNILLFDFSRVLLHPKDKNYSGSLNELYRKIRNQKEHNFFDFFELNKSLLSYLEKLKLIYPLYILTSEDIQNAPEIQGKLNNIFTAIYSAKDLGFSKKDPHIYKILANQLQKRPEEFIFIDDTIDNIHAAEKAGMNIIHFVSSEQLINTLSKI